MNNNSNNSGRRVLLAVIKKKKLSNRWTSLLWKVDEKEVAYFFSFLIDIECYCNKFTWSLLKSNHQQKDILNLEASSLAVLGDIFP